MHYPTGEYNFVQGEWDQFFSRGPGVESLSLDFV